jgi:carotenoid cleavage dioxygenase-like enzyme
LRRPGPTKTRRAAPRRAAQVRHFRAPAFLATHWVNAFESPDGRHVILDACVTKDPAIMGHDSGPS